MTGAQSSMGAIASVGQANNNPHLAAKQKVSGRRSGVMLRQIQESLGLAYFLLTIDKLSNNPP